MSFLDRLDRVLSRVSLAYPASAEVGPVYADGSGEAIKGVSLVSGVALVVFVVVMAWVLS